MDRRATGWVRLPLDFEGGYTFEERIGCGELGAVFRARRARDGAVHAVKVPRAFRGDMSPYDRIAGAEQVGMTPVGA